MTQLWGWLCHPFWAGKPGPSRSHNVGGCVDAKYLEQALYTCGKSIIYFLEYKMTRQTYFPLLLLKFCWWEPFGKAREKHTDLLNACCMRQRSLPDKVKAWGKGNLRSSVIILIKSGKSWGKRMSGKPAKACLSRAPWPCVLGNRMLRKILLGGGSVTGYRAGSETEVWGKSCLWNDFPVALISVKSIVNEFLIKYRLQF